jgi:hypothetical protein
MYLCAAIIFFLLNSRAMHPDAQFRESDLEAQIHNPKTTQRAQEIEKEAARGKESVGHKGAGWTQCGGGGWVWDY